MRILIALDGGALPRGEATEVVARQRHVDAVAEILAEIAAEHEVVVSHEAKGVVGCMLELALRNALPDRDVITISPQVVVSADDPAFAAPAALPAPDPSAIAGLRSVRALMGVGALVIFAGGEGSPTIVGRDGTMRRVDAAIDGGLTAALLARRLEADLFLTLAGAPPGSKEPEAEAPRRFVEATGGRAATATLADAVRIVDGAAGAQVAPS